MLGYNAALKYPNDILFISDDIHKYKFLDELSVCAYWSGNYLLSLSLINKLINMNIIEHNNRFLKNKQYNIDCLNKKYNIEIIENFTI